MARDRQSPPKHRPWGRCSGLQLPALLAITLVFAGIDSAAAAVCCLPSDEGTQCIKDDISQKECADGGGLYLKNATQCPASGKCFACCVNSVCKDSVASACAANGGSFAPGQFCEAATCDKDSVCGDGVCQESIGEDCFHCPEDCACAASDACTSVSCQKIDDDTAQCLEKPAPCDDNNPCTDDFCDPSAGCVFTPNTQECDDGDPCTSDDTCSAGSCSGETLDCDDANPCTDDFCDVKLGVCAHQTIPVNPSEGCTGASGLVEGICCPSSVGAVNDCPPTPYSAICDGFPQKIHVSSSGSTDPQAGPGSAGNPFATLAEGLAAASNGEVICIGEGTYTGPLSMEEKNVSVVGVCPGLTRITGAGITVNDSLGKMGIFNLTFSDLDKGVHVKGVSSVTIRDVVFERVSTTGIHIENVAPFPNLEGASKCLPNFAAKTTEICNVTARYGIDGASGIWIDSSDDVFIRTSHIHHNTGPGLFLDHDEVMVRASRVSYNRVGIAVDTPTDSVTIAASDLEANEIGGIIAVQTAVPTTGPVLTATRNAFVGNSGTAISVYNATFDETALTASITGNAISSQDGLGVHAVGLPVTVAGNTLDGTAGDAINSTRAIEIAHSPSFSVEDNSIQDTFGGAILAVVPYLSGDSNLSGNTVFSSDGYGIAIQGLQAEDYACNAPGIIDPSKTITVEGNVVTESAGAGMVFESLPHPMVLSDNIVMDPGVLTVAESADPDADDANIAYGMTFCAVAIQAFTNSFLLSGSALITSQILIDDPQPISSFSESQLGPNNVYDGSASGSIVATHNQSGLTDLVLSDLLPGTGLAMALTDFLEISEPSPCPWLPSPLDDAQQTLESLSP